ncbi:MAG: helix-turn-helix transcriptional regulator [Nitrospiraceae bacterium]|nr:helix-turn-helix transcriptional regulator [Nitrospiraceae bacterium]
MLTQIRKLFGYTQAELAKKVGVTQNYYTQIENGLSKSAPLIGKISNEIKIKESFLLGHGKHEYPFLSDFYIFNPSPSFENSDFVLKYICAPSDFIDVVFLSDLSTRRVVITCLAMRDDHDTVFLFKRQVNVPGSRIYLFSDNFRDELHYLVPSLVYETTRRIPDKFMQIIENGTVERNDVIELFPGVEYFEEMYKAHKVLKK